MKNLAHLMTILSNHHCTQVKLIMSSIDAESSCIVCNKSDTQFCNRCRSTRYCSKVCQRADWPTHKLLCAPFSNFDATKRPSKDHFRAIFFPASKEKPELIWLHCPWDYIEEEGPFQHPDTKAFLGKDAFSKETPIQYNPILERKVADTVRVCYRDTFLIDGSRPNESIKAITSTESYQSHDWRGPILAYGREGLGVGPVACKDLDMNDFRHVTDFFLSYGRELASGTKQPVGEMVKGVRINCLGDQKILDKPKFEAVEVTSIDPIFSNNDASDIAKRIELAVFTRRCPPDSKWANDKDNKVFKGSSPFNNQDATFLHLCCDPKADFNHQTGALGWGWASMQWQNSVGSVIVVRQDKKPLLPLHAEALCKYCRYEARSLLAHSIGEYAPEKPMERGAVLAMICRPAFVISWYKLLEEKSGEGEDTGVPYPYYDVECC
ncbi:hypothetical protein F4819DRAFT_399059 [Hypoxylon fuscum]|nr:hypothetical protein F4819DRAFT_399059 [Hypoxylon fuscum]